MPGWCPLSQQPCRDDCEWLNAEYKIDEEGIERETFCAVAVIAGWCIADGADPTEVYDEG